MSRAPNREENLHLGDLPAYPNGRETVAKVTVYPEDGDPLTRTAFVGPAGFLRSVGDGAYFARFMAEESEVEVAE